MNLQSMFQVLTSTCSPIMQFFRANVIHTHHHILWKDLLLMLPRNEKIIEEKIPDVLPKQFLGLFQKSVIDGTHQVAQCWFNYFWNQKSKQCLVGHDSEIKCNVHISRTTIGDNVTVGKNSKIINSIIMNGATIGEGCTVTNSIIGKSFHVSHTVWLIWIDRYDRWF